MGCFLQEKVFDNILTNRKIHKGGDVVAKILPFPKSGLRSVDQKELDVYLFYMHDKGYSMTYEFHGGSLQYGLAEILENAIQITPITESEAQNLFKETFHLFFITIENENEPGLPYSCTLFVMFNYGDKKYAVYADQYELDSPYFFMEIVDEKPTNINDELQLKRVTQYFEQAYRIAYND
jgi:hypothetical protein